MNQEFRSTVGAAVLLLTACTQPGQAQYGFADVGKATVVEFGFITDEHQVAIIGQNTGTGAIGGAAAGAIGGSAISQGRGSLLALVGGAIVGGIAGHMTEQALQNRTGLEFTIDLDSGKTITIVQNLKKEDAPLAVGARCMVQTSGQYQRVLPSTKPFPDESPQGPRHKERPDDDNDDDTQ